MDHLIFSVLYETAFQEGNSHISQPFMNTWTATNNGEILHLTEYQYIKASEDNIILVNEIAWKLPISM